ncbi:glycerol-3-phosphate acyltransferase 2, mitochondrial isoform 1-T6 [Clarias gariepinus]|uniref:glycerol-3-phosphate acyltransferase 2, mitochondrial n=1 Tax=Clarias gariepinus TaxID=13013 RepID=UPI00234D55EF|nr:glycerol-3-phosphate acyltransferase 2, mitochondrial [Clarias gariepinus]XP_053359509.1 glycerol-3-phosphate acyltransferase 2, mitochondrial [Clarias gariepinus]XP_053359510.1 glycerol-3-phosphate acyltransferase 2, mitochondrial [Clarias gariepinus]XP_053359511.1 glycerol-3-phosphate acyltransferase 2, mitochondrial [Clarias gariepinus]XP_053359512.1 glycerol-3-phosphate acyltransferase 2, mitochondrial [Clarias gariepinus]XP_053359513.1 glycerol-3-phosphate acyltransferase 2, mitochondr
MTEGSGDRHPSDDLSPQPKSPDSSWGVKIRKKLKAVAPYLGKFRPLVGQCCHQCTPESLSWKLLPNTPSLNFQNLLYVNETHTRYRGWLVRRVCCVLFIRSRKVEVGPVGDRLLRICNTDRVKKVLAPQSGVKECGEDARAILTLAETSQSPTLIRLMGWFLLRFFSLMFCNVQVNLSQMAALHRATQPNIPLVYVYMRQGAVDQALISLTLLCHNLKVPYSFYSAPVHHSWMRVILRKLGVVFLPDHASTEQEAETHSVYSPVMTSLVGELLMAGESLSVGVCEESGCGGQWLARIRQAVAEGLVPDVSVVPVGISYDCPPSCQFIHQPGMLSVLRFVRSLLSADERGGVRIHFAQAFSLKEMCDSGKCRVDGRRPLQDLLLPVVLHNRKDTIFGQRDVSWLFPSTFLPELSHSERQLSTALTLHLMHSVTSSMAVMSTSMMSCLLLHKHRRGVRVSVLCRDLCWLLEEVLFRRYDVGFGGSVLSVVFHALSVLRPHLLMAAAPPSGEPLVTARPDPHSLLTLGRHSQLLTHVFIKEAVGACAVFALLCEVAGCGGEEMEFDVALGQEELTEKCLQLTHLLPAGYIPPCKAAYSFAMDAVDSVVRCGILIIEEVQRDTPACDFWKRQGVFSWTTSDDPEHSSDSDCEEQDTHSYKLSQPSHCPRLLLFLCSLLSVQLRALSWAIESLDLLPFPLTDAACVTHLHAHLRNKAQLDKVHHESSSIKLARMALRTLTDFGVLTEDRQSEAMYLRISPLFLQAENKHKLFQVVSQFVYA